MKKVVINPNREFVKNFIPKLKKNDGYCPCSIFKTPDTKCMCREFRDQVARGELGPCHCGLHINVLVDPDEV